MIRNLVTITFFYLLTVSYGQDSTMVEAAEVADTVGSVIAPAEEISPASGFLVDDGQGENTVIDSVGDQARLNDETIDDIEPIPQIIEQETPVSQEIIKTETAVTETVSEDKTSLLDFMPPELQAELLSPEAFEELFFTNLTSLDQEAEKESGGLLSMLSSTESISGYKLNEYQRYLEIYFPDANSDLVQTYIINTYLNDEKWDRTWFEIVKFLYLYPQSEKWDTIRQTGLELISEEKYYRDFLETLKPILENTNKLAGMEINDRYYSFLKVIKLLKMNEYNELFINESQKYCGLFPNDSHTSEIILWLAKAANKQDKNHTSYLEYGKILTVYPRSVYLPVALYQRGKIQAKHFNEYENAIATYREFLLRFSSDTLAESAQLNIAQITDEKLKDWVQAVDEYQVFADAYPNSSEATSVLMRIGEIKSQELNQGMEAIDTYHYLVQLYSQSPQAVEALMRCGQIQEDNKRYSEAVGEYFNVYQSYPKSEQALPALDKCLELYEKRIKNTGKVKEILQIMANEFPESKSGKSAQKKLEKM